MNGEGILPAPLRRLATKIRSSPLASRLVRGSAWSLVGSVTSRLLALAAAILAARILGKTVYGELGMVQTTVTMFGTLAGFGMGTTATKFVAEFRASDSAKAGRIIALSGAVAWVASSMLAVALAVLAPLIASDVLKAPQFTEYLRLGALLLLFTSINGAQNGVLSGFEAFKRIAFVSTAGGMLNFPLVIAGAWLYGLPGLMWGMIIAQAATCALNHFAIRAEAAAQRVPLTRDSWRGEAGLIWSFSTPAVIGAVITAPVSWLCGVLLVRQPGGFAEMGALNAASQWLNALMWLPYMLGGVVLPMLAERMGAKDQAQSTQLLIASIKINAAVVLPLVLAGSILSPYIMSAYGSAFRSEWPTLVVTLLVAGILAIQIPAWQAIAAAGRMWAALGMNVVWALLYLGLAWAMISFGSLGVATAQLLAYLVYAVMSLTFALKVSRAPASSGSPVSDRG